MPKSLTLIDFSDRDLLYALEETGDAEGWATSRDVALRIGVSHENPAQCVGSRFAWLRRFGIMDTKVDKEGYRQWRLNDTGESLLHPKDMTKSVQQALDRLTEGQRVRVTEIVSRQIAKESRSGAHLSRRAWTHSMGNWRDPQIAAKR